MFTAGKGRCPDFQEIVNIRGQKSVSVIVQSIFVTLFTTSIKFYVFYALFSDITHFFQSTWYSGPPTPRQSKLSVECIKCNVI